MTAINELQGTLIDTRAGLGDARIGQQSRLQGGLGSVTKRRDRRRQPNFLMRASTTANTPNATDQLCPALLQATSAPKGHMWRQSRSTVRPHSSIRLPAGATVHDPRWWCALCHWRVWERRRLLGACFSRWPVDCATGEP